ncbi:polysialic acid capsule expression protein [gut metagenome]|uniref:Polysialic acid capsule expression protein n=1 Tax=gut metagenome TaxID=749906 RepID=J9CIP1_9ZZZZ
MITAADAILAISYSGETNELLTIVPTLKREGATLIAMTGNPASSLARYADVHINCHVNREACPLNLAPTTSTTMTLALGDALAVACLSAKGFTKEDFARSHPGGALGRRLLIHVQDIMRTGNDIPSVLQSVTVLDAVREITKKHIGMTSVVDDCNRVVGIFTEGDLRRLIERVGDIRHVIIGDVMNKNTKDNCSRRISRSCRQID